MPSAISPPLNTPIQVPVSPTTVEEDLGPDLPNYVLEVGVGEYLVVGVGEYLVTE